MNKELFELLLSEEESQEAALEKQREKKMLYKEYEEAVKKFVEDEVETDKIKDLVSATAWYCNDYVNLLNTDDLVKLMMEKLLCMVEGVQEDHISLIIEHAIFLGKISALYAMYVKKQEEIRKDYEYKRSIEKSRYLKTVLNAVIEDNVNFNYLCEISHIEERNMNRLLNERVYFNVRNIGQEKLVSLTPEGKYLQKYLKRIEAKRYTQEELENYIYMNSHRLINLFRKPKGSLPKNVTVISLSDIQQNHLSFEFYYVYNEISSKQSIIERDIPDFGSEMISGKRIIDSVDAKTRRKENAGSIIQKLRQFSKRFERNNAVIRL